jgi:hypothetical protein
VSHILRRQDGLPSKRFDPLDLERLQPTKMLNDVCINGGAALLQDHFSSLGNGTTTFSQRCAIFSTYDLPRARYQGSEDGLWRNTYKLKYWEKDIWILPIHRPKALHWVLCVVDLRTHQLFLFDSFAELRPWEEDVPVRWNYNVLVFPNLQFQDIVLLLSRLADLASKHGNPMRLATKKFTARPLNVCT